MKISLKNLQLLKILLFIDSINCVQKLKIKTMRKTLFAKTIFF
jgi:hypothetical protein